MSNYQNQAYMLQQAEKTKKKWEKLIKNNELYSCKKCQQTKPADEFVIQYIDNQLVGKYRYLYECRQCKKERTNERRNKKRKTIEGTSEIMIAHLLQGAKKREIEFTITKEDLLKLWEKQGGKCYYSGIPMTFGFVGYTDGSWNEKTKYQISCDRKDNNIGYIVSNIILCCTFVKSMKHGLSEKEFKDICGIIGK